MSSGANVIEIKDLMHDYRQRDKSFVRALESISLNIERGTFVSIVGPSGCGKTTVLRILAGLVDRTHGSVSVDGIDVRNARAKREIGVVFQSPTLLPWRTVLQNLYIPIDIRRGVRKDFTERALALLEVAGLAGNENRYPHELSGGMQQRVGICRALMHDPAVLLMDEPFGALDALSREFMNIELQRIWMESNKTVLFITHSIPEAVFLSDRVVVMSQRPGEIVEIVDVKIDRPRDLSMLDGVEGRQLVSRVRAHFSRTSILD
jgi:NitT/TauT family transport system ATP-binding protein